MQGARAELLACLGRLHLPPSADLDLAKRLLAPRRAGGAASADALAQQGLHDGGYGGTSLPPLSIAALLQWQTERLLQRSDVVVDLLEAIRDSRVRPDPDAPSPMRVPVGVASLTGGVRTGDVRLAQRSRCAPTSACRPAKSITPFT